MVREGGAREAVPACSRQRREEHSGMLLPTLGGDAVGI